MTSVQIRGGAVAIIDDCDAASVLCHRWFLDRNGYARRRKKAGESGSMKLLLHRLLAAAPPDMLVDHVDGNKLNNCRANLRLATHAQNTFNSKKRASNRSGFKGVSRRGSRWGAFITKDRRQSYLGLFGTPHEAALAYDSAARQFFGEFAACNYPDES